MNNYIWLGNYKYVPSNVRKPYFKTLDDREEFLSKMTKLYVNNTGVNINLVNTFEFRVVVNKDITDVYDKNFACLSYNDEEFYCDIIEMNHVSKDRTQILCSINPFFQYIDYLSFYKNFYVTKCTGSKNFLYGKNAALILNKNYRTHDSIFGLSTSALFHRYENGAYVTDDNLYIPDVNGDPVSRVYRVVFLNCLIINKESTNKTVKFINSEFSNFDTLIIPLLSSYKQNIAGTSSFKLFHRKPSDSLYNAEYGKYSYMTNICRRPTSFDDYAGLINYINQITPSAASFRMFKLPFYKLLDGEEGIESLVLPFYYEDVNKIDDFAVVYSLQSTAYDYLLPSKNDEFVCRYSLYSSPKDIYDKITFYINSPDNKVTITARDYIAPDSTYLEFRYYYIINPNGDKIAYTISSDGSSCKLPGGNVYSIVELKNTITYAVDSEEKFNAENRYYDELTKNAKDTNLYKSIIQGTTELLTGATQIGLGSIDFLTNGSTGGISNGFGNLFRGAASYIGGAIDAKMYLEQRDLERKNAQARPDEFVSGSSVALALQTYSTGLIMVISEIIEEDYEAIKAEIDIYGCSSSLYRQTSDEILDFILTSGTDPKQGALAATCEVATAIENGSMIELIKTVLQIGILIDYYDHGTQGGVVE